MILLAFIFITVLLDYAKLKKKERLAKEKGEQLDKLASGVTWYKTLHKIKIPPVFNFKEAQIRISLWLPMIVGFATGVIAGLLGIGGGLIRMPALIYLVGCPTHVAVGTDLFEVMISGLYGTFTYTWKGRTELLAVFIMLIGAGIGAQFGAVATKYFKGMIIRVLFGSAVCIAALSIAQKLIARVYDIKWLDDVSTVTILGGLSVLMVIIVVKAIIGMRMEVRMKKMGQS